MYSVFNSNLLFILGPNLAINKLSRILRLPMFRIIASILTEKLLSLFLHLINFFMEWGCTCVDMFFNSNVERSDCKCFKRGWDGLMAFSLDVVSLYTTVPAHPAVNLISKHISSQNLYCHNNCSRYTPSTIYYSRQYLLHV